MNCIAIHILIHIYNKEFTRKTRQNQSGLDKFGFVDYTAASAAIKLRRMRRQEMAQRKGDALDFVPRGMTSTEARQIAQRNRERAASLGEPIEAPDDADFDVRDAFDDRDLVIGFGENRGRKKVR